MVVMLVGQILQIFQHRKGLGMFEIGHSLEGSKPNRLEVSVSPLRGIMNMLFLVFVPCSPNRISVSGVWNALFDCVLFHLNL